MENQKKFLKWLLDSSDLTRMNATLLTWPRDLRPTNDKRPSVDAYLLEDNLYLATKVIKEVGIDQKNYFGDPENFCEVWAPNSSNIVVVTDYLFDSSQKTGYHVAVHVKAIHPSAQVVLFSDFPIPEKEREVFDSICPKCVPTLNILLGQLSNSSLSE